MTSVNSEARTGARHAVEEDRGLKDRITSANINEAYFSGRSTGPSIESQAIPRVPVDNGGDFISQQVAEQVLETRPLATRQSNDTALAIPKEVNTMMDLDWSMILDFNLHDVEDVAVMAEQSVGQASCTDSAYQSVRAVSHSGLRQLGKESGQGA